MPGRARLAVLTAIVAMLHGAARAAEPAVSEAPLLVVVETGPGAGCDAAAVRGAIAAELKARVAAPTARPIVALAGQRSDVLLVAVDRERIVVTLRGRGDRELTRAIAAPADRAAKLRAVAWLAGNVARDQLGTLALPEAVPVAPPAPVAAEEAPPAPDPRPVTEPPPMAAPVTPVASAPVATVARSQPPAPELARPRWTIGLGWGTAILFQGPTVQTTRDLGWGMAAQLEVQRHLGRPTFVGAALDAGPRSPHQVGVAALAGLEHRSNDLFVAASMGLGVEWFRVTTSWWENDGPNGTATNHSYSESMTVPYARAALAAGYVLAPAVDLIAELTGHLAAVQRRDAGFAMASLGLRFKLR